MSPAGLLDLPDDEESAQAPRRLVDRRGVLAALLLPALWLGCAIPLSRALALGGWRDHWFVLAVVLVAPAAALSWWAIGPGPQREAWPLAIAVLATLAIPSTASGVTPSPGRLSQIANDAGLPGHIVREDRLGNGRCRPACSEVRRTAVQDGISFTKARAQLVNTLKARGYEVRLYSTAPDRPQRVDAGNSRVLVSIEMRRTSLIKTTIESIWLAQGPAGSRKVG